jgi:hypothetical protein
MLYKPNYCCNCGEKIERPNPSFTDSKMFCDVCKHDFVLPRVLPVAFASLMAIVGIFGLGSLWRGGETTLTLASRQLSSNTSTPGKTPANTASPTSLNSNAPPGVSINAAPATNSAAKAPVKQNAFAPAPDEAVYFCGAETKKGTPCSRRVRGGGRCWQHQGQTALLPAEKLQASR